MQRGSLTIIAIPHPFVKVGCMANHKVLQTPNTYCHIPLETTLTNKWEQKVGEQRKINMPNANPMQIKNNTQNATVFHRVLLGVG